ASAQLTGGGVGEDRDIPQLVLTPSPSPDAREGGDVPGATSGNLALPHRGGSHATTQHTPLPHIGRGAGGEGKSTPPNAHPDRSIPVDAREMGGKAADAAPTEPSLGAQADPRTFLRDEDFPRWIRELPTLPPRPTPPAPALVIVEDPLPASPTPATPPAPASLLAAVPEEPSVPSPQGAPALAAPIAEPASAPASPEAPPARPRAAWETALLVLLGVGVVAAVLWALVANGLLAGSL
ncbi:MAG: hypothetical protein KC442_06140, partial [Thermomicrobiales bacterium]|nr:hypothetical protein [Thermomicrobiales bacterium]